MALVLLPFERAHVAAARVFFVGTWEAALVGLQQMAVAVGAAFGRMQYQTSKFVMADG